MNKFLSLFWLAASLCLALQPQQANQVAENAQEKAKLSVQQLNQGGPEFYLENLNGGNERWNWSFDSYTHVCMVPDAGVYAFQFGEEGTYAYQNFIIHADRLLLFEVFDCFCGGDQFAIYDYGQFRADQNLFCNNEDSECEIYSKSPEYCINGNYDDVFCYSYYFLEPGHHNITIGVEYSPFNGGTGFARLTTACQFYGYPDSCCYIFDDCSYKVVYKNKECGKH